MKRALLVLLLLGCTGTLWATVPDVPYFVSFSCSGSYGPYPFTFPVSDAGSISVYIDGALVTPTGNWAAIPVNNNFNNGGSITLTVGYGPCNSLSTLEILRATPKTQTIQYYDNMPTPFTTFGRSLDKLTEITQEVWGETVHSLQMQVGGVNFLAPASGGIINWNFVGATVTGSQTGIPPNTVTNYLVTVTGGGGGSGVSSVSGDGVLFDNSGSTGAVTLHQKTFTADNIYGNFTGSTATPSTQAIPSCAADGAHSLTYASHTLGCTAIIFGAGSFSSLTSGTNTTAAMLVGTGSSLAATGTGVVNANQIAGHSVTAISGNTSTVATTTGTLTSSHVAKFDASGNIIDGGTAGAGTVTSVSSGSLSPLFNVTVTNPTSTPGLSFSASNFVADAIYGNFTGSSAPASTQAIPACANDGVHAISYPSHTLTCSTLNVTGGGVNLQTANYTLQASDVGKLVVMNCGSSCTVTMYGTPSSTYKACIESIGSSTSTVSLNSLNYNGASSVPVLIKYNQWCFYSDGSNYFGSPPPAAGTSTTLTAATNSLTIGTSTAASKRSCEVVWAGTGSAGALQSGDDAAADQSCLNDIGVTETIISVKCRSDASSSPPTVNPSFGATGTGTNICSGALTCGTSGAYSSTCTVSNASLTAGSNINPVMASPNGTSIHMVVTYTLP